VVFHATYLSFMERARTELLNESGIDLARMADERGVQIMVSSLGVKYHAAARLNELVSVSAEVVKIGRASVVFVTDDLEATYEEIEATIHAHPTLSEAVHEATGAAFGHAIHI